MLLCSSQWPSYSSQHSTRGACIAETVWDRSQHIPWCNSENELHTRVNTYITLAQFCNWECGNLTVLAYYKYDDFGDDDDNGDDNDDDDKDDDNNDDDDDDDNDYDNEMKILYLTIIYRLK